MIDTKVRNCVIENGSSVKQKVDIGRGYPDVILTKERSSNEVLASRRRSEPQNCHLATGSGVKRKLTGCKDCGASPVYRSSGRIADNPRQANRDVGIPKIQTTVATTRSMWD